ncbi:methanobactin export MATE transporter MbnM [Marinomonas balearica]|uniref:Cytochrome c peroxidase n=1 Tax=Marinomonas balearica TaxID=491947 RepID=A0A4R6M6R6_9GAMM|nr:methanobactin export MATE transporter MbnM [Marinomonas balearica]TDO95749.1 cytochrome c peroxidase [Marinomonas balearica]
MRIDIQLSVVLFFVLILRSQGEAATQVEQNDWQWNLPHDVDPPFVPENNPMSSAKVELGRELFFDSNLSGAGYVSCSTCHLPERSFSENRKVSVGITGEFHTRNALSLVNTAYMTTLTWADPNITLFEEQAKVPMFGTHPIEMGTLGYENKVLNFLSEHPLYPDKFKAAFPKRDTIDFEQVFMALGAYQRTLISVNAPYDQYRYYGQKDAISEAAIKGEALFFSKELGCSGCHAGRHFSDATGQPSFHNTGLYNVDKKGSYPQGEQGLFEVTNVDSDKGKFRTPTLRNIELSAPYMHDGSINTLEEVIAHYAAGGRSAMETSDSPLRDIRISGFELSDREASYLIEFLKSLTDTSYIENQMRNAPFQ